MIPPLSAAKKSDCLASPIVELRQYTLKPGRRETLIGIFDAHLIEGQEEAGMTIIGQFRDLDRPDMFVWMRGFDGMEARKDALTAFYDGSVWAAWRDAANATMIDSDDVLLLKPAWRDAGFDLSGLWRPAPVDGKKPSDASLLASFYAIQIHHLRPGTEVNFAGNFEAQALPVFEAFGVRPLAAFVSEHAENSFPRLPVRVGENVFVSVTGFDSADAYARHEAALTASPEWQACRQTLQAASAKPAQTLRLSPTARSLLR
ncbi:NIPSNAP family protein [Mesorhizobium sp. M00.F.Ca.ET.216.01.1.1]|uniref:NIPSNAP family protein n=1 Tax=Mesorhizobium sp. M00.F.Ca.ET.216.01.1.1 TaxID=2500528 RepID=UPI000FD8E166|nr:NIPSNAP family protein [Mesorhizobium sp. M00.F.Ca.ET.216.01.1.1]TGQ41321.1 NIPSNAP family protein [Mesorhizobium sp. M00.F.Ca.ET.216.01.1.1]